MATFEVLISRITDVRNHMNADRLSIVSIGGFQAISAKKEDGSHRYEIGDLAIFIGENSVLPEELLKSSGFWNLEKNTGSLSGKEGNRVKPSRLRGEMSYGIILPTSFVTGDIYEGRNVVEELGVTKYIPELPATLSGEVFYYGTENTLKFDIEHFRKYTDVIDDNEIVSVTEKIHGTFVAIGYSPTYDERLFDGHFFVSSKGQFAQGLVFKNTVDNVYTRIAEQYFEKVRSFENNSVILAGEIFGKGIQDLHYGFERPTFRAFDIFVNRVRLNSGVFEEICANRGIDYIEPFEAEYSEALKFVAENIEKPSSFDGKTIKEGYVLHRLKTREKLKIISDVYLTRKGGTEFN